MSVWNEGDLVTYHLRESWRHAVRAFNTAQNAQAHQDTLFGLAMVVATISQQLEYRYTMATPRDQDSIKPQL